MPSWNDGGVLELAEGSEAKPVASVAMPSPGGTVREWLAAESGRIDALLEASAFLLRDGAEACSDVAGLLDGVGTPEELLALAFSSPDTPTAEVLAGVVNSVGHSLAACSDGDAFDERLDDLAWSWAIASRRIEEIRGR